MRVPETARKAAEKSKSVLPVSGTGLGDGSGPGPGGGVPGRIKSEIVTAARVVSYQKVWFWPNPTEKSTIWFGEAKNNPEYDNGVTFPLIIPESIKLAPVRI